MCRPYDEVGRNMFFGVPNHFIIAIKDLEGFSYGNPVSLHLTLIILIDIKGVYLNSQIAPKSKSWYTV